MSLSYMATKLHRGEMTRDLGEIVDEIHGWGELKGMPGRQILLLLYKVMLPFLRTNIGDESVNILTLFAALLLYGIFLILGFAFLSLPLIVASFLTGAVYVVLCLSRDRRASAPYSFGRPRPIYRRFFGRFFSGWSYYLFYEPLLCVLPLLLATAIYLIALTTEGVAGLPTSPSGLPSLPALLSPWPLLLFCGFHAWVLAYTPWWLFSDESEVELETRAALLQQKQESRLRDRLLQQTAKKRHATVRRR